MVGKAASFNKADTQQQHSPPPPARLYEQQEQTDHPDDDASLQAAILNSLELPLPSLGNSPFVAPDDSDIVEVLEEVRSCEERSDEALRTWIACR